MQIFANPYSSVKTLLTGNKIPVKTPGASEERQKELDDTSCYVCFRHKESLNKIPYQYLNEMVELYAGEDSKNIDMIKILVNELYIKLDTLIANIGNLITVGGDDYNEIESKLEHLLNRVDIIGDIVNESEQIIGADVIQKMNGIKRKIASINIPNGSDIGQDKRAKILQKVDRLMTKTSKKLGQEPDMQ